MKRCTEFGLEHLCLFAMNVRRRLLRRANCVDSDVGLAACPDDVESYIPFHLLAESPTSPSLPLFGDLSDFEMASDANRHVLKRKCSENMEDHDFLKRMRFWDFNTLRLIMKEDDPLSMMIKELQGRGCVVTNISANAAERGSGSPLARDRSLNSSGEVWQSAAASVRKSMLNKGLYQKHPVSHPLLKAFSNYLEKTLGDDNFKQEVENVARFLFFMDPVEPSLEFVWQPQRVWEYVNELKEAKQSRQTIQNYLKSIRRFLKCHTEFTILCLEDEVLHHDCEAFLTFIDDLQSEVSKQVIKATRKRYERSPEWSPTPVQCCAVLEAARTDFLKDIGKLSGSDNSLTKAERQLVLFYLEAVLVLKHLQRPGVVQHMTVGEWLSRKSGHVSVKVKATRLATFILSEEEEMWFEMYFRNVRPVMVGQKSSDKLEEINQERFFISSTGKPIYKVSNDVEKLHLKYKLPNVTSEMARCASRTANKLREMLETSASSQVVERSCLDEQAAYDVFVKLHPVTVDGTVPEKSQRVQLTGINDRQCYDRWLSEQMKLRVQHVLEYFGLRQPSETRLRSRIKKQGWTVNLPDAAQILSQWKPSVAVETAMSCRTIRRMIRKQRWKGLEIMETGVFTTRPFASGEVVCDYHSRLISREEGLDIHNSHDVQAGHLFFFTSETGQAMCFDAHDEHCECHPNKTALGRLITHSSKRANVRPRLYRMEDQELLLFIACRDIDENKQLRYDYGSNKKSFAGEDLDLLWC